MKNWHETYNHKDVPVLVFIDIETTGTTLAGDKIIEIGATKVWRKKKYRLYGYEEQYQTFHSYVHPEGILVMDPKAQAVHGLTLEFLKDKPPIKQVISDLRDFILNDTFNMGQGVIPVVMHNQTFDWNFIQRDLRENGFPYLENEKVCTLAIAREKFSNADCALDRLCKYYNIPRNMEADHGAIRDAWVLKLLFDVFTVQKVPELDPKILKEKFDWSKAPQLKRQIIETCKVKKLTQYFKWKVKNLSYVEKEYITQEAFNQNAISILRYSVRS